MAQHDPDGREKKSIGGDLVIPLAAVAFTLYYFWTILDSPWEAQVNAFFIGSILLVLAALFLVLSLRRVLRGEADLGLGPLAAPLALAPRRIVLLLLTLGYIVALDWGGFTLTTFAFLAAAMLLLTAGRRPGLVLSLAAGLALGGYLLFIVAFDTRFPRGPFERLMQGLF